METNSPVYSGYIHNLIYPYVQDFILYPTYWYYVSKRILIKSYQNVVINRIKTLDLSKQYLHIGNFS